jgi:glycosyltransferase involved in cell wall biosynthesis
MVIYNLGDNYPLHGNIFTIARHYPGIVILHDLVMHHFFSGYYFLELRDQAGYINELAFAHGEAGRQLAQRIIAGEMGEVWETETMLQFHMAKSALHGSLGVITHSEFARREIEAFATYPLVHIDFPAPKLNRRAKTQAPDTGKVRFLSFGMLNSNKMIDRVIDVIAQSPTLRERVIYDVIGTGIKDYLNMLHQRIDHHKLQGVVNLHGYQPDDILHQSIKDADVIINLRNPHFGESSWVLLEAAFSGKPTVVWKHGYYDEYPDDTVVKVTNDTLPQALEQVMADPHLRQRLSENIQRYARQTFVTERYCRQLLDFVAETRRQKPLLLLTDKLSRYIEEIDPENRDLVRRAADEIANLLP